ncbi:hypothetical protein EZJ49_02835 [Bdellovibrio bacteriovorus]|uniref:hypothetical protein n=1 Tax=Bdellovibrio bacteriovorus TaxID=959 RepID=UPI0021D39E72|nr:hypothetical protein [Bdellovibrio bacteriovorus]UXR65183.1 hypothetical protein EZJ49_02835 [Bdellovibrio bacteriovorus]
MGLLNRVLRIFVALTLLGSSALADIPQELQDVVFSGDLNGRSSVDFRSNARNIKSLVPKDSEATILETRQLKRTGSYGLKVRLTKVGDSKGTNSAKVGDEVWVYFSQKDPWLAFKDKEGSEVQDPEEALTSRAQRDGEGLPVEGTVSKPTLPTKEIVKATQKPLPSEDPNLAKNSDPKKTEGDICVNCSVAQTTDQAQRNIQNIRDVKTEINKSSASIPRNAAAGKWSDDPMIMRYSEGKEVKNSISYGIRNKRKKSSGYCYRYVKRALMGGDMIDRYPPGGHARDAVRDLKAQGMINLMDNPKYRDMIKSPADVPKGAVIVYHNGTKESGDVQIKTDWGSNGGFVSDFYSGNSFLSSPKARRYAAQGKPYRMIGVMIKP